MKLSLQISRGLFALSLCAAAGAYAIAHPQETVEPNVAHNRVDIVTLTDRSEPHWVVASVHVGAATATSKPLEARVAAHLQVKGSGS